jgi:hypothetical protein
MLYASTVFNLQNLFVIVSGLALIFTNLGKRKRGQLSGYSVFNAGFRRAAGTMDAEQMLTGVAKDRDEQRIFGAE